MFIIRRDLFHGFPTRHLPVLHRDERIPKNRSPHCKSDQSLHLRACAKPLLYLRRVCSASQDYCRNLVTVATSRLFHHLLIVARLLNPPPFSNVGGHPPPPP